MAGTRARTAWVAVIAALTMVATTQPQTVGASYDWRAVWGSSIQNAWYQPSWSNLTCRMMTRASVGGDAVEVRLSNAAGTNPVTISHVTVGIRTSWAKLAAAPVEVTFKGSPSVTIGFQSMVTSDPATLQVAQGQDIAVSVYYAASNPLVTVHELDLVTNFCTGSGAGDMTSNTDGAPYSVQAPWNFWVDSVAIHSVAAAGTVVALGDSITDGMCTARDSYTRWTDVLAGREQALPAYARLGVVNEGISGNAVTIAVAGQPAVQRVWRDVLTQPGLRSVIVYMGVNDLIHGVSSDQLEAGLSNLISQIHSFHAKVIGVTISPAWGNSGWTAEMEANRQVVNRWIRDGNGYDAIMDASQLLAGGVDDLQLLPAYDCGDHVHPNISGLAALANAVPMSSLY